MKILIAILFCFTFTSSVFSQKEKKESIDSPYKFNDIVKLKTSAVKNQYNTGTCWSFATTSFIETELLRLGKEEFDLSEMYFARLAYTQKAINYVRLHGLANFGQGGQAHDVLNIISKYGAIPEPEYKGINYGEKNHNHEELEAILTSYLKTLANLKTEKLSSSWLSAFNSILDNYFGNIPSTFNVNNNKISPIDYAKNTLAINPDEYIEITSYTHHPFYQKFVLEVPDNWDFNQYYNVPLEDLINIMKSSLNSGYSIAWDGDVSENNFSHKKGIAVVLDDSIKTSNTIGKEKAVTQEIRQLAFDNYSATDDHLMHIIGLCKDQNGTNYFITKNSWGCESNKCGGFLNISEEYAKLNTIAIMVNKKALPEDIAKKLGL